MLFAKIKIEAVYEDNSPLPLLLQGYKTICKFIY